MLPELRTASQQYDRVQRWCAGGSSGGLADPTTIYGGGSETITAGGTDVGAQISGGVQFDYGLASGVVIFAGSQVVESGGTANSTTVSSGGMELILSGGSASGTGVSSGGTLELASAAPSTPRLARINAGGIFEIGSGSHADQLYRQQWCHAEVASGGTATGTTVSSGGTLELLSGATVSGTVINVGGIFENGSGYTLSNYFVSNGATLEIGPGGTAIGLDNSGGTDIVLAGATAYYTSVVAGLENVFGVAISILGSITFSNNIFRFSNRLRRRPDDQHPHHLRITDRPGRRNCQRYHGGTQDVFGLTIGVS